MSKNLKVVLVGLPGSGKSTFGRQLAQELGFPYLDLDQVIEEKYQNKIPEIFSIYGEGKFREWESKTLEELLDRDQPFVLASGGGAPCFNDNMELINSKAISVYLDVPLESISRRLQSSKVQNRPMFQGLDQGEITLKLKSLLVSRESFYNQAKIKLSGEDFSAELLMYELINLLKS
ncbi:shikimate kinase [Algoriphagus aquaeductus]|jgi:shikimate kinase|uniref:Shikimate kinase n=1 Tax=Algoriphagus aquaeductus TaxID=475299 RepID=A0A326RT78_9BACT|nr:MULTISPECIES: shikimate kinase [Algoriphagus]PZV84408.1 shikimate kinase [Algoriphagus aquaeductus]